MASLLFADDAVLLASSDSDCQHTLGLFAAECEVVGLSVSTSKSESFLLENGLFPLVWESVAAPSEGV